jgi:hypothetical protein
MSDGHEEQVNQNWNIIISPNEDGSVSSRHLGLTLLGACAVLKAVLDDYEKELAAASEEQSDA